ncbi:helix-turn-helix domain-containing protein [Streptomyces albogriseolus]|uniref:helix-turn-helix domain-containing protein n=1 Tax=Streptomyces albogriseolus TaxID=1887 RepID=UPI002259257E|nr:helix-turn-helix transcriptional regulator [Streptomyces viridodiastaticus]MCX4623875.1 helix-turn-helix domain-containing protein [Streptomyces viridodiastaticus]
MGRTTQRECGTAGRRGPDKERPAAWSAYGKLVRLFRERAGLTQQALADAIGYSMEQVASVEQGRRPAKAVFTEAAERVLDAGGALRVLQPDVDRAKLPLFFQDFALLETEAVSRFSYDPMLVPGLLQTEAYARALLEAHFPPLEEEAIEQHLTARLARQSLLTRKNPCVVFSFILEEGALRRAVGGNAVLAEQLAHLQECSRRRNVEIQVMPNRQAAHSGVNGQIVLLETVERRQFVSIEAQGIVNIRSDRDEVSEFWLRYGMLRSQALNTEESARLIERMAGEL